MKLNELEIKIHIETEEFFKHIHTMCEQLFGPISSHAILLDEYFDTTDRQLKKQDLVIRIRTNGNKKIIALKSPRVELSSGMNERIELEFLSADGESVQEQLERQGLSPIEASEKERWTFVHGDCEIFLDRLPFIGNFIEIEGPSEEAINKIVQLLEISSCTVVKKNYGELMLDKFQELNLPLSNICATFAKDNEFKTYNSYFMPNMPA